MNKDAYYFPHDSNARNDQRLLKVRFKHGASGYGAFFMLLEIMREQGDYRLSMTDLEMIDQMEIHIGIDSLIDIVENYDLFEFDGGYFYSNSFDRRMQKMNELRDIRAKAGRKGGKSQAKSKQNTSKIQPKDNLNESIKLKEIILKESKSNNIKSSESKYIKTLESIDKIHLSELQDKNLDVDVEKQFDMFKDYLSANGKSYKDYRAGFRTWLKSPYCEKTTEIRDNRNKEVKIKARVIEKKELEDNSASQSEIKAEIDKALGKISRKYTV